MNGTNDRGVLAAFLREQFEVVDAETGTVLAVAMLRHSATADVSIHGLKAGSPGWGKHDEMAETFDGMATRDARGVVGGGAMQYSLQIIRDKSGGKATATLPFIRVGTPHITGANGSLASEPPTSTGLTQMGQRWGEIVVQGAIQKDQFVFQMMATMIADLRKDNLGLMQESREWMGAMRNFIADTLEKDFSRRVELLKFQRNTKLLIEATRLAPAAANQLFGIKMFPDHVEDQAFTEALLDNLKPEEIEFFAAKARERNPMFAGLLMSRLAELKKRRAEEEKKLHELAAETTGLTPEEAERDAAGEVIRILRGKKNGDAQPSSSTPSGAHIVQQLGEGKRETNGTSPGTPETPKPAEKNGHAAPAADDDTKADAAFAQMFLGAMGEEELATLTGFMRMRGQNEMADRAVERFEAMKKKGAKTT